MSAASEALSPRIFSGHKLAEIDFAQPGIVTGRAELPSTVGEETNSWLQHRLQVGLQPADQFSVRTGRKQCAAQPQAVGNNQALDGGYDSALHIFMEHRGKKSLRSRRRFDGGRRAAGLVFADRRKVALLQPAEKIGQPHVHAPALHGQIEIIAGLAQRDVEAVVRRDFTSARAPGTVQRHDAVPLGGIGVVAPQKTFQGTAEYGQGPAQPAAISRLPLVNQATHQPVDQFFMRHVREAPVEPGLFISRVARSREVVGHAHIMREAEAAGIPPAALGEAQFVRVGVTPDKPVELIGHRPRIKRHFEEHLIRREVKGVHHAILAFIDDPHGSSLHIQELRASKITVDGLRQHELAGGIQFGAMKSLFEFIPPHFQGAEILQGVIGNRFHIGKVFRIVVTGLHPGRDYARPVKTDDELKCR